MCGWRRGGRKGSCLRGLMRIILDSLCAFELSKDSRRRFTQRITSQRRYFVLVLLRNHGKLEWRWIRNLIHLCLPLKNTTRCVAIGWMMLQGNLFRCCIVGERRSHKEYHLFSFSRCWWDWRYIRWIAVAAPVDFGRDLYR